MRCAYINQSTNIVENLIVANPSTDPVPDGYFLVEIPDDSPVSIGWIYTPSTGQFVDPNQV